MTWTQLIWSAFNSFYACVYTFIVLAAVKTFNSDVCRKLTNALYQRWVELFALFSTVNIVSKCCLKVLLETVIYVLFHLMVNQWMVDMWLLFETKQKRQIVLWFWSHEFGVAMFSSAWMICMLICVPVYDVSHLPYFCGIQIYSHMVTYSTQLLSGWKCM